MSKYRELAKLSGVVAAAYEVFFVSEDAAKVCQRKKGGEMKPLDDGWLVRIPVEQAPADDPVVMAIKKAVDEAKSK